MPGQITLWWQAQDRKILKRINLLIVERDHIAITTSSSITLYTSPWSSVIRLTVRNRASALHSCIRNQEIDPFENLAVLRLPPQVI